MCESNIIKINFTVFLIFILILLFDLLTLSNQPSADSSFYAFQAEIFPSTHAINPYHVFIEPLNAIFYKLFLLFGWSGNVILPLQILNAIGGAFYIVLFYSILNNILKTSISTTKKNVELILISTTAAFGFSGSIWLLSTEAEFVLLPLVPSFFVIAVLIHYLQKGSIALKPVLSLALLTCVASLFYLTNIFLIPVIVFGIFLINKQALTNRFKYSGIYFGIVLLILLPFFSVIVYYLSNNQPESLTFFLGGDMYGSLSWENIPRGVYAFLRSIALYPHLGMNDRTIFFLSTASKYQKLIFTIYYFAILFFSFLPIIIILKNWKSLSAIIKKALLLLFIWTILCALFAFYWVPSDISFWVVPITLWFILFGLSLTICIKCIENKPKRFIIVSSSFVFATFLFIINGFSVIFPHHFK